MVVRFEVDACIPPARKARALTKSNVDDLTDALANVSFSSAPKAKVKTVEDGYGLRIRQAGSYVPQSNIIELATVSIVRHSKGYDWSEAYPQIFLSHTPHHYLAVHKNGRFEFVEKRDLGTDFLDVEESEQPALRKLRQVLGAIKDIVVEHGNKGRLTLVQQGGELKVYERNSKASCLPEEILKKFEA